MDLAGAGHIPDHFIPKSKDDNILQASDNDEDEDVPDEGESILDVIPVDSFSHIWKLIVANMGTLTDLQNAINTEAAEWKRILDPKRKLWLFPHVFPFLTRYLRRNDVLRLRQVCSAWSLCVDQLIEEAIHPVAPPHEGHWRVMIPRFQYLIAGVRHGMDVDAFLKSMRDHPRNPFIGRELKILQNNRLLPVAQLQRRLDRFLRVFGHHLSYIQLSAVGSLSQVQFSKLLGSVLTNAPNLKELLLYVGLGFIEEYGNGEMPGFELPRLLHLQTLQLDYDLESPNQNLIIVQDLIKTYSPQLRVFEVRGVDAAHWTGLDWGNLTELHVTLDGGGWTTISSLFRVEAPQLAKLYLRLSTEGVDLDLMEFKRLGQRFPKLESYKMCFEYPD